MHSLANFAGSLLGVAAWPPGQLPVGLPINPAMSALICCR